MAIEEIKKYESGKKKWLSWSVQLHCKDEVLILKAFRKQENVLERIAMDGSKNQTEYIERMNISWPVRARNYQSRQKSNECNKNQMMIMTLIQCDESISQFLICACQTW